MTKSALYSNLFRKGFLLLVAVTLFTVSFSQTTIFSSSVPSTPLYNAGAPVEVGVKFRVTQTGYITGVRFYKGAGNTGTHIGHLWSRTGTKLAEATFTSETASGWQQVNFATPVAVATGTTYVVSYFSSSGNIAINYLYFLSAHVNGPLRALGDGEDGSNGVYGVSNSSVFPTNSVLASNFWVDVLYTATNTTGGGSDVSPPTVTSVSPSNLSINLNAGTTVSATFSEAMNAATVSSSTFELRNAITNALVPSAVVYNSSTKTVTLYPNTLLTNSLLYTATVKGGTAGVKDVAGNALNSNYSWTFIMLPLIDLTAPTILSVTPANAATGVSVTPAISAVFSEEMSTSTISASRFQLTNASNVAVPFTLSYNANTRTATLTPTTALAGSAVYKVTVLGGSAGVKDASGNTMSANYTWSFTTVSATPPPVTVFSPTDVPVNPFIIDQSIEAGMKFQSSQSGYIKGIRYYKGAGTTGMHVGHLWNRSGDKLGEATFVNETASGWQQVLFATPVPINAGETYIASYFSPNGIYGYTNSYFTNALVNGPLRILADGEDGGNGVYVYTTVSAFPTTSFLATNYYADVMFTAGADVLPPTVMTVTPGNNATNVNYSVTPSIVFNEPVNAATINSSTIELRNTLTNALVASTITYNAATHTATITPVSPLPNSTAFTAKVKGGASGVKDVANNPLVSDYIWSFTSAEPPLLSANDGPGGPILVICTGSNPFSRYPVEILRAEGLNEFAAVDISTVTATTLSSYDVIVLGEMSVTADQVSMFTNWVNGGGTLIAFRPSALLSPLLGINNTSSTLNDKYLLVNGSTDVGAGIVNQTIQYHGMANLCTLNGATSLANIYSDANTATNFPAVTTRNVGASGGRAVAFTYDLAKSIIYTRQGNPAYAGQKRDGQVDPIRSDDLFFPDWVDFNKIAIPQADEQQRLFANIILQSNIHRKPLPRFWYLPRDLKAAIVMTGDDHANNGTQGRFDQYKTLGPNTAQDVADWKAIRGTSYMYPGTPITNAQAMSYESDGFEIAVHPTTNCVDFTLASLQDNFTTQIGQFTSNYPGLSPSATSRTHCLAWSDWSSTPKVELQNGIRLDATYYYWPETWMQNRPGMFTGSGMPMRFADLDGSLIDVYQAPTQMTDETNMDYTTFCNSILDKALGSEGYYGVFTANMHNDANPSPGSDAIIAAAQARQVPVISAKQMLAWLDGRNNSSFGNMVWSNGQLTFNITVRLSARNLKTMLPMNSQSGQLTSIKQNGANLPFTVQTIKGIQYAFFAPATGTNTYVATYGAALKESTPITNNKVPTTTETTVPAPTVSAAKTATADVPAKALPLTELYVNVTPNPGVSYFNLIISSNDANPVTVTVRDLFGRVLELHEKVTSTGILRIGNTWAAGTYFAEILQGDQRKVMKLIKTN